MYEHRTHSLLDRRAFIRRVMFHVLLAVLVICFALGMGILGYHYLADLPWLDAL